MALQSCNISSSSSNGVLGASRKSTNTGFVFALLAPSESRATRRSQ
eukprot:CAMPEP_0198571934 /NCGR_PEP_ID=MMETSP1462-20131121/111165_1 /TAXON_ID=1333877 /ORGANISM="Brandtodinium nutriculum, Strain RCC3387" /LENGTH=45 /DNA_ID= /DNA_START= /DNA_END= /DNA_ORIENTATION=